MKNFIGIFLMAILFCCITTEQTSAQFNSSDQFNMDMGELQPIQHNITVNNWDLMPKPDINVTQVNNFNTLGVNTFSTRVNSFNTQPNVNNYTLSPGYGDYFIPNNTNKVKFRSNCW